MTRFRLISENTHISHKPLWCTTGVFFLLGILAVLVGPAFVPTWVAKAASLILICLGAMFATIWVVVILSFHNVPKLRRWRWRTPRDR